MSSTQVFATKLPVDLKKLLDDVSEKLGLRKNFIIETALREKLEDLLDTYDLEEAEKEVTGFHDWNQIKKELKQKGKL